MPVRVNPTPTPTHETVTVGEAIHWYRPDGTGVGDVPKAGKAGAKGETKKPTIKEARAAAELGEPWMPGATGVLKVMDKPALVPYFKMQVIESVLTNPKLKRWVAGGIQAENVFVKELLGDSEEHAKSARDEGSIGHGMIANSMLGRPYSQEWVEIVLACQKTLTNLAPFAMWAMENSFACLKVGWGGTIDAHAPALTTDGKWSGAYHVVDFKGRVFTEEELPAAGDDAVTVDKKRNKLLRRICYPDDLMQLTAYSALLHDGDFNGSDRLWNLYFSRSEEGKKKGLVLAVEHTDRDQKIVSHAIFKHAREIWALQRRYNPCDYGKRTS